MPKEQNMKTKHNPDLVHEFHYGDGDVGAYAMEDVDPATQGALSRLWDGFAKGKRHKPSHIVIRCNTKAGQAISNRLQAATAVQDLQTACEKLIVAYQRGEANGSEMKWEDVDDAWEAAKEALAKLYGCTADEVGDRVLPVQ